MKTTGAVVELLVAGLLFLVALVWLGREPLAGSQFMTRVREFPGAIQAVGVAAVSYQLGFLVNGMTYWIARLVYHRHALRAVFGAHAASDEYTQLKARVWMKGESAFTRVLDFEVSVHRILRAGGFNFCLLALVLVEEPSALRLSLGTMGIGFWALAWHRQCYYFRLLQSASSILQRDTSPASAAVGEGS